MVTDVANSKVANCTTEGVKAEKCSRTGCTYTKVEVLPKTHNVDWTVNTVATCTTDGKRSGYCTACKQTIVEAIPAKGHTVTNAAAWVTKTPATCTKDGSKQAVCSTCGGTVTQVIPATGHTEVVNKPAQAPTCQVVGYTEVIDCAVCGAKIKEVEVIPALGHDYVVIKDAYKTPTCTENGAYVGVCSRCNDVNVEEIPALGHKEEIIPGTAPTCTESGISEGKKCIACGVVTVEQATVPPTHSYQAQWQTIIAPTCNKTGTAIKICKNCFDIQTSTLDIISHNDADGDLKCDMCALDMTPANPSDDCSCNCHKDGMSNFLFKFILFFQKIFRQNKECACGVAHY